MDIFLSSKFNAYYEKRPLTLVDVGASGGLQSNWRAAEKHLKVVAFEPDERAGAAPARNTTYLKVALFNKKTVLPFHLCQKQEVSSIFKPNRAFVDRFPESERFNIVERRELQADTLDNQLAQSGVQDVDFIKLDAQGCELAIMEGARKTLESSASGLEVEVEFAPIYEGQPLFPDVHRFLTAAGFELFDLRRGYWKRAAGQGLGKPQGQLVFADALYLRNIDGLAGAVEALDSPEAKASKVLRAISVCLLYGYADYAMELAQRLGHHFSQEERPELEACLRSVRSRAPGFRGRGKIAGLFHALWKRWRPTHRGWATVDPTLGNLS